MKMVIKMKPIARYIDHTLLKPESTKDDIIKLCEEAKKYEFKAVCVNPYWVSLVNEQLKNTNVEVATVIGFPFGATSTLTKVVEARNAIKCGASELDMVMNIGALKSSNDEVVQDDIEQVVNEVNNQAIVKVIIETALLTDGEKIKACQLSKRAGAQFVKTSTGFSGGGATVRDITLMKEAVKNKLEVKASGGIRDLKKAKAMIAAGATRIGASSSVEIVTG